MSMPERSTVERQNSVEDDDSHSYLSGSSGDPTSPSTYDEFVKSKGMMQDDQEVWMSMDAAASSMMSVQRSLDSWKSRRRRATSSALERKASREEVEQTEQTRQRRRSKTYQEMMEEKEKREKILMKMATKKKSLDAEDIVHILTKPSLYEDEITENDLPERDDAQIGYNGVLQSALNRDLQEGLRPGVEEAMTFSETLLRNRERDLTMTAEQKKSKSSARLPQKKRLSLGIFGRVAAFNKGESAFEDKPKEQRHHPQQQEEKWEPEYQEFTIKLKQKPRNENGFGFTILGGSDSGQPIVVTSIAPGSTAGSSDLKVGDEIVAIDGDQTRMFTYDHAMFSFSSSILSGELVLKIHRYDDPGAEKKRSFTSPQKPKTEPRKTRSVSQPSHPAGLSQAARARKILDQMREEEEKMEDERKEREEQRKRQRPTTNGSDNWNHRDNQQESVMRSYYNLQPRDQPLGDAGPATAHIPQHIDSTPQNTIKPDIKTDIKSTEKPGVFSNLKRNSPDGEQYGKPIQVGIEVLGDDISPIRDTVSPDARVVLDDDPYVDAVGKYPDRGPHGTQVDVAVEILDVEEALVKSEVALENEKHKFEISMEDGESSDQAGPHRGRVEDPVGKRKPQNGPKEDDANSDGEMFSSEDEDERVEADIMARMHLEEHAEQEREDLHRRIEEDEQDQLPVQEDLITPQMKQKEQSAPPTFQHAEDPPPSFQHSTVTDSKPTKYHPVSFSVSKPFTNRLGPEPYKPPAFRPVKRSEEVRGQTKQDMMKRRSDFFNDEDNRSGQSSPVTVSTEVPTEATPEILPMVPKPQTTSLSSRKTFNMEEEKKRLERWHGEQERIRQEQYEQEQRRLKEQQEKDLERAESEERRRKMEEHQKLSEKQRILQEQAAEEKKRLEEERRERLRQEQEFLEQARLEREEEEAERLKDEEEQRRMAAERKKRDEERKMREDEERKRKDAERKAEEEAERRRREEEWHAQELERQDQEAEARRLEINRIQEKQAEERSRRKREEEARQAQEQKQRDEERFNRLREEEIERIRAEEREKLRHEWDALQREKVRQEDRERQELERLAQLRAEQERLREERIKLEQQQEEERRQLQKEKERVMAQKQQTNQRMPIENDITNSKAPQIIEKENKISEFDNLEKEVIVSQAVPDVHSAPPPKSLDDEDEFNVPGQSYLSKFHDGRMGAQHWLVEEAERRRLAEKNNSSRLIDPVEANTGPIVRKDLDLEPVLEKKAVALQNVAPVRCNQDKPELKPTNREPITHRQHSPQPQEFREVPVDVPANFHGVQRRLRGPEDEAERKKKVQNRRSLPEIGGRVPDVVRKESHSPPPQSGHSEQNNSRMPDNFLQQPQLGPPGRNSAFQQPSKKPAPGRSVSGKVTCSNCSKSLGRGAAMIIESLGLHYHIECFRCCVCNIQLGNGSRGTDVRIRASKLHCQNCYSNDAGFEFTEV